MVLGSILRTGKVILRFSIRNLISSFQGVKNFGMVESNRLARNKRDKHIPGKMWVGTYVILCTLLPKPSEIIGVLLFSYLI